MNPSCRPVHLSAPSAVKGSCGQRYNMRVPSLPREKAREDESSHRHHRHAVYASETTGLLLIAFLLLALTLIRYWHGIHWSLR